MTNQHRSVAIRGLRTATPDSFIDAAHYAAFATRLNATIPREEALIHTVTRQSGIEKRHTVIATQESKGGSFAFYEQRAAQAPVPSTAERMALYAQHAPPLAERAARASIEAASMHSASITHLVTASCTGFFAPGIDSELIHRLNLPNDLSRTHIGFMGCHAAINVLATAASIVRANPAAVVLCVCVELCTLHFQRGLNRDTLLPNSLFGDGAAAFVATAGESNGGPALSLHHTASRILPNTTAAMTWNITDTGFRMTLDSSVPDTIQQHVHEFVADSIRPFELGIRDIAGWAIHPGGPRIVDAVLRALHLSPDHGSASRHVLSQFGNMSSPTVLFILDNLIKANTHGHVVMLAFGPGLAAEMALMNL